jgi:methylated-DNA-protein-cysteine methyltransferase-like protein
MARYTSPPHRDEFNRRVWELVRQVPAGKVITYGRIAEILSPPEGVAGPTYRAFGARWVGSAMANCPGDVPWQRVVNAGGRISERQGGSHHLQRTQLEQEGVVFDKRNRLDLGAYEWSGPGELQQGAAK